MSKFENSPCCRMLIDIQTQKKSVFTVFLVIIYQSFLKKIQCYFLKWKVHYVLGWVEGDLGKFHLYYGHCRECSPTTEVLGGQGGAYVYLGCLSFLFWGTRKNCLFKLLAPDVAINNCKGDADDLDSQSRAPFPHSLSLPHLLGNIPVHIIWCIDDV